MAEEYKPIDMKEYPYKAGDKLPGGITVVLVKKGTDKDSSKGLRCRERVGINDRGKPIYGDFVICKDHIDAMDGEKYDHPLEIIGIEPDPQAQWVYYNLEGVKRMQRARPDEFLETVKSLKSAAAKPDVIDNEKKICKGTTKAGEPCKRAAINGEDYCSVHLE